MQEHFYARASLDRLIPTAVFTLRKTSDNPCSFGLLSKKADSIVRFNDLFIGAASTKITVYISILVSQMDGFISIGRDASDSRSRFEASGRRLTKI
jgi:hypothetical protein